MGYIYEDYKKDIDGFQNDYDYLQSQVDAALSAELAGDTATARDISESLFEQSAADNTKIITPDEYAAWIRDAKKASTEGKYDADWQAARADEHFVDKTSLKETRDQSFSEPDAEDLEDLEKAIQNNQDILGDAILERQQAMAAAGIPIENPAATEGDKLAQDLANRMRWSEQCYLVNHIGELSDAHRLYQRDYSYIDLIDGSPAEFMNRLYHRPYSGDIVSITPDDASELTPLFRLSKVLYEWKEPEENSDVSSYSTKYLTEVPIIFEKMARQDLYDFDPRGSSRSFATPRSWSFVSQLLSDDLPESTLTDLVAGCVGEGLAVKFMNHRKISGQLPNPSDILSGKVRDLKSKEISAMYSLTVSLCYELQQAHEKKDKTWNEQADRFFNYMMDNFETELVVMGAKIALTNYKLPFDPSKLKSFDRFHKKFGKYVITAMESK